MMVKLILFLKLLLVCTGMLTAQNFAFQDPEGMLSSKEKQYLEKAMIYEAGFFNKVFPDESLIELSDTEVVIFNTQIEFLSYALSQGKDAGNIGGYFDGRAKKIVMYRDKNNNFLSLCYHELSHLFIRKKMRSPPTWLNEGLACYFESMEISAKTIKIKKNSRYIARLKTLSANRDVSIANFITWNNCKFVQMLSYDGYGYAVAYGIVWLLFQTDEHILISMMRDMRDGLSSADAFNQYYPGGLVQFESDFFTYYK